MTNMIIIFEGLTFLSSAYLIWRRNILMVSNDVIKNWINEFLDKIFTQCK